MLQSNGRKVYISQKTNHIGLGPRPPPQASPSNKTYPVLLVNCIWP